MAFEPEEQDQGGVAVAPDEVQPLQQAAQASQEVSPDEVSPLSSPSAPLPFGAPSPFKHDQPFQPHGLTLGTPPKAAASLANQALSRETATDYSLQPKTLVPANPSVEEVNQSVYGEHHLTPQSRSLTVAPSHRAPQVPMREVNTTTGLSYEGDGSVTKDPFAQPEPQPAIPENAEPVDTFSGAYPEELSDEPLVPLTKLADQAHIFDAAYDPERKQFTLDRLNQTHPKIAQFIQAVGAFAATPLDGPGAGQEPDPVQAKVAGETLLNTLAGSGHVAATSAEGLTTPSNVGILTAMTLAAPLGLPALYKAGINFGFGAQMAKGTADQINQAYQQHLSGDDDGALETLEQVPVTFLMSVGAASGGVEDIRQHVADIRNRQRSEAHPPPDSVQRAEHPEQVAPAVQSAPVQQPPIGEDALEQARRRGNGAPHEQPAVNQVPEQQRASSQGQAVSPDEVTPVKGAQENAVPESRPGTVLQRQPQEIGEAGSERQRVESGEQGNEVTTEGSQEAPPERAETAVSPDEISPVEKRPPSRSEQQSVKDVGRTRSAAVIPPDVKPLAVIGKKLGRVELPDGSVAYFDRSKASAAEVMKLHSEGALHRLTGEKPPEATVEQAKQDLSPKPATEQKPEATFQSGSRLSGHDGRETQLLTPSAKLGAKYRVVEARDLIPSNDRLTFANHPKYPQGVQERTYDTSKEAQARVIEQAQKYDPAYTVNSNPDAVNGPPVITPDGIVLGGNSRAMSTQRLYDTGKGDVYKNHLAEHAQEFGLDKDAIAKFKEPVLVREVEAPRSMEEMRRMGSELNKSMTGALGVSEKAVTAGKSITPETHKAIAEMLDAHGENATLRDILRDRGKEIIKLMVDDRVITERERPQFVDTATGGLSDEGKKFVERALMGSVIDDPVLLDSAPKSIVEKLGGALGSIAAVKGRGDEWNITPIIKQALEDHTDIAHRGMAVGEYLNQNSMFSGERNPLVDALVRKLAEPQSSVRKAFREFAADSKVAAEGQGLLGLVEAPSVERSFNEAFGTHLSGEEYAQDLKRSVKQKAVEAQPEKASNTDDERQAQGVSGSEPAGGIGVRRVQDHASDRGEPSGGEPSEGVRQPEEQREAARPSEHGGAGRVEPVSEAVQPWHPEGERGGDGERNPVADQRSAGSTSASREPESERPAGGVPEAEGAGERAGAGPTGQGKTRERGADGHPVDAPVPVSFDKAEVAAGEQRNSRNHVIKNPDEIASGTEQTKIQDNVKAIETLKALMEENRPATPEEQAAMARYVGWGGLSNAFNAWNGRFRAHYNRLRNLLTEAEFESARASTINAHYTSMQVVDAMWNAAKKLGFKGGNILEPSMGIGNFFGRMPEEMKPASNLVGVEMDALSGEMAKRIYPDANVLVRDFKDVMLPDGSVDFTIGNVPFFEGKVHDPHYKNPPLALHNYFIMKTLDKTRPGGVAMLITSRFTLDAKSMKAERVREMIADRADLVAALRLPDTAFEKNAGTKVTTDLLILRKRASGEPRGGTAFSKVRELEGVADADQEPVEVNEYYHAHPENMLGRMQKTSSAYGDADTLILPGGEAALKAKLQEAISRIPENTYNSENAPIERAPNFMESATGAPAEVKAGAFFEDDGGRLKVNNGGMVAELPDGLRADDMKRRIRAAMGLRDRLNDLFSYQLGVSTDDALPQLQAKLNDAYMRFVRDHGYVSGKKARDAFGTDPDYPRLLALEDVDPETKRVSQSAVFTKRTQSPFEPLENLPKEPRSALLRVLAAKGKADIGLMAKLMHEPEGELAAKLESDGLVYRDPKSGSYQTDDEYLSGDVRQKLADAENAAAADKKFDRNVEALKKVQPERVSIDDAPPRLGMSWVPTEVYQDFFSHLAGNKGTVQIKRTFNGEWKVKVGRYADISRLEHKWGAGGMSGKDILEYGMNQRPINIYEKQEDGSRRLNQSATLAAREKLSQIQSEFDKWSRSDSAGHREKLEDLYNQVFNGSKPREFSGAHLTFPGINPEYVPRGYQANAVWRIVQSGRAMLAHSVGLGKTLTMISAGMESKRLGLSKKNMYAVPNHLVQQWVKEFRRAYPGANVLSVGEGDFTKENRNAMMSRIATGDWDAVVIPHSQFDMLPVSPEIESKTIRAEIASAREALEGDREDLNPRTVKQIEKSIAKLTSKLKALSDSKKDNTIYFDHLGVDMMFVDEAHAYKNLPIFTRMGQVSGLPSAESQRALNMKMKTDYMRDSHNGRGVVFATGTPLTNTMAEVYNMTRYLAPEQLEKVGIRSFDDWAANFGNTVTNWEYSPDGVTFRPKTAFAKFLNVPELSTMWREFADVKSKADAGLKEPRPVRVDVTVPISEQQNPMLEEIAKRGELLQGIGGSRPDPTEDNWLKLSSDARKISLDPRLYDHSVDTHGEQKVDSVAAKVKAEWEKTSADKGTQLVFSDFFANRDEAGQERFNIFHELRDKLVDAGIPESHIAIIHDFPSRIAKEALFQKVREGRLRVLMGSTDKLGVGTNVQDRLAALHHLDQPWRPDQVEQREGRAIRQGNGNDEVRIYRYISEPASPTSPKAYDLQMYQQLARKQTFIQDFMAGKVGQRSIEDAGGSVVLNAQTFKIAQAMSTGNPDAMRKFQLEHEVNRLSLLQRSHEASERRAKYELQAAEMGMAAREADVRRVEEAEKQWKDAGNGEQFSAVIDGKKFADRKDAVKYLEASKDERVGRGYSFYGVDVPVREHMTPDLRGQYSRSVEYQVAGEWHRLPETPSGVLSGFESRMRNLDGALTQAQRFLEKGKNAISSIQQQLSEGSPFEKKLHEAQSELEAVNLRLGIGAGSLEDEVGDATAEPESETESNDRDGERGFAHPGVLLTPVTLPIEAAQKLSKVWDGLTDKVIEKTQMGRVRPEVRAHDEQLADALGEADAAPQYYREKADKVVEHVIGGLSRDQEKGFVLLADKESREWLAENKNDEYQRYYNDPQIELALARYKPYEEKLREAVQSMGGNVIEDDYLHRAYDAYTSGINEAKAKKDTTGRLYDSIVTPQIAKTGSRMKDAGYYYAHGLHEFGPSFATRYIATMMKVAEHRAAVEFLSKATRMDGVDPEPAKIFYNGNVYYNPEVAKMIRESRPGSKESKELAEALGVEELPKPDKVEQYAMYSPFRGGRVENAATALAKAVIEHKGDDESAQKISGHAQSLIHQQRIRYAGPVPVVEALNHDAKMIVPRGIAALARVLAPGTKFIRQQVVGLGFGIPHYMNELRRIAQTAPMGVANPVGWARAWKVLTDKTLKERGISGVDDPTFDMLLRHGGISPRGAEDYRKYIDANLNPKTWGNAFRTSGQQGAPVTAKSFAAGIPRLGLEALRSIAEVGHKNLFKPGGIDQRARLWLADYLKSRDVGLDESEVSHLVNQQLGRYNRATWTQLQKEVAPFMMFPGWDMSSVAYVLKHPIRTSVPPALIILAANNIIHALGGNKDKDRFDMSGIHIGGRVVNTNLLNEPLARHAAAPVTRAVEAKLQHRSTREALGEAAKAVPGAVAGATTNMAHPYLSGIGSIAANREHIGSPKEIVEQADYKKKGKVLPNRAVEKYAQFGVRKVFPLADRATDYGSGFDALSGIGGIIGIPNYKEKPKKR